MAHHEEVTDLMAEIASLRAELERAKKHAADMNDGWRKANFENHDLRAERDLALRQRDHHIGILDKFEREAGIAARQDAEEKARLRKELEMIENHELRDHEDYAVIQDKARAALAFRPQGERSVMSSTLKHHHELTNGVGKCSVPMWQCGCPSGFCDEPAYGNRPEGKQWRNAYTGEMMRFDGRYNGYVSGLACPGHGGPEPTHFGDPCVHCGIPHDDIPVGPCQGEKPHGD